MSAFCRQTGIAAPFRVARRFAAGLVLALGLLSSGPAAQAQNFQSQAPFAVLLDSDTGAVLYEKAADELMVPASMAKLATVLVAFLDLSA